MVGCLNYCGNEVTVKWIKLAKANHRKFGLETTNVHIQYLTKVQTAEQRDCIQEAYKHQALTAELLKHCIELGGDQGEQHPSRPYCSICMDDIDPSEIRELDSCHHTFHHHCISQWLERSPTCPLCKSRQRRDE
jgi:hypothetical protein